MIFVLWRAARWLGCPGEEGRPRDQPLAAVGLTACQDGLGREGWYLGRKIGANPAPRARTRKRWERGDWSCPGLARAGHSPTAQWLPRGYILASMVSPAAGTGAAGTRGAWQRTSASRTSGSSRARMVPTGSSGARRGLGGGCAFLAEQRAQDLDLGELRCRRRPARRRCCSLRRAPTLYGSLVGGVGGSSTEGPSALTSPYSEPGRLDNRPRKPSIFPRDNEQHECTPSFSLSLAVPAAFPTGDSFSSSPTPSLQHNSENSLPSLTSIPPVSAAFRPCKRELVVASARANRKYCFWFNFAGRGLEPGLQRLQILRPFPLRGPSPSPQSQPTDLQTLLSPPSTPFHHHHQQQYPHPSWVFRAPLSWSMGQEESVL